MVSFNVDTDRFVENTAWVTPGDGILVDDRNGDGIINDITETLSEYYGADQQWISSHSTNAKCYDDGLVALKPLDNDVKIYGITA